MSARIASRSEVGIAANAWLLGANTVNGPAPLSVSVNPAAWTADATVVRYGLLPAAIATGSSAMPTKEPSPSGGIAAHDGPWAPPPSAGATVVVGPAVVVGAAAVVVGGAVLAPTGPAAPSHGAIAMPSSSTAAPV